MFVFRIARVQYFVVCFAVFDQSGNFVIYATMLGIKGNATCTFKYMGSAMVNFGPGNSETLNFWFAQR